MSKERRINERLLQYWDTLRGDRKFAAETQIDPEELADIWDDVFLAKPVGSTPEKYRYTYLGAALVQMFGDDITGRDVADVLMEASHPTIVDDMNRVIRMKTPLIQDGEFTNVRNVRIKYRRILLPLGPNDTTVDYLIGGVRWVAV